MAFYKTRVSSCSDEEFIKIIRESRTYKEALSKLGYHHSGGAYITLRKRIKRLNISVEHMTPAARYGRPQRQIPNEEIFIKGYRGGVKIRKRVLEDNLVPYICAICGQTHTWNGKELTLTLDHINGDHYDNRIENLRFLCPNCDSQQPTFGAKNKKGYGSTYIPKKESVNFKTKAKNANVVKENKVSKELFLDSLKSFKNFTDMGRRFNVSDNAIRKWCRKWDLPTSTNSMKHFVEHELTQYKN